MIFKEKTIEEKIKTIENMIEFENYKHSIKIKELERFIENLESKLED